LLVRGSVRRAARPTMKSSYRRGSSCRRSSSCGSRCTRIRPRARSSIPAWRCRARSSSSAWSAWR